VKRLVTIAVCLMLATGCSAPVPEPTPTPVVENPEPPTPEAACLDQLDAPEARVLAFFHCAGDEEGDPRPVARDAHAADPVSRLEAALIGLVGGPSESEAASGYVSPFSERTELVVQGVSIDDDGLAIVELADLREAIPNGSATATSRVLLAQLNATVFQITEVDAVEYRMGGSCEAFWGWLQTGCTTVERSDG
jgi:Sporulation and spore germination